MIMAGVDTQAAWAVLQQVNDPEVPVLSVVDLGLVRELRPLDEGLDWQHELQVNVEPGGWHTVTLTIAASARFVQAWREAFPGAMADEIE